MIETIVSETGKAYEDAQLLELGYAVSALSFWAAPRRALPRASAAALARSPLLAGRRLVTRYAPRGLVGVIGPWNYPLLNSFGDAIPALAAGNSVLLKPSELTPLTSLLVAEGLRECGLPDGVFAVATGGAADRRGARRPRRLRDVHRLDRDRARGRGARRRAALTPCSLELGGKDALIVLEGAPLERAANVAVYYGMLNGGQSCISIERVYVAGADLRRVRSRRSTAKVAALRVGRAARAGRRSTSARSPPTRQLEIIESHVADALAQGRARRGRRPPRAGPGTLLRADRARWTSTTRCAA